MYTYSRGHIFHVSQHFATKLGISTNFRVLFSAIVKYFALLAQIRGLSIMHIVYYTVKVLFENYRRPPPLSFYRSNDPKKYSYDIMVQRHCCWYIMCTATCVNN